MSAPWPALGRLRPGLFRWILRSVPGSVVDCQCWAYLHQARLVGPKPNGFRHTVLTPGCQRRVWLGTTLTCTNIQDQAPIQNGANLYANAELGPQARACPFRSKPQ